AVLPIVAELSTAHEAFGVDAGVRHLSPLVTKIGAYIEALPIVDRSGGRHAPVISQIGSGSRRRHHRKCKYCRREAYFHCDLQTVLAAALRAARRMAKNVRIVLRRVVANFTLSVSESVSLAIV